MIRGDACYRSENYQAALELYTQARTTDPALGGIDERILNAKVRLELQRGDQAVARKEWDNAERAYTEARRLEPQNPDIAERAKQMAAARANEHFGKGQQLLGRGNPFDAIAEFEQALTFQANHPRAAKALERALGEKHDRETQAESAYQEGTRALGADKFEAAIQSFTAASNLNPHHPSAERELGQARARYAEALVADGDAALARKQWPEAAELYRKALSQRPGMPGVAQQVRRAEREGRGAKLVDDGNRAFERNDWKTAVDRYTQARELTADHETFAARLNTSRENLASDTFNLAQSAERAGNLEEALARYRSITQFYPKYRDVEERSERLDVTLRTARRAFESGCRYQEEGNLREAREQFRMCAELVPGYAKVAERQRSVDEAFAKAESLYSRAVQAESRGDRERARVLYEECLAIASPFRDAAARLAKIRDALVERSDLEGRYEEAVKAQTARDLERARKLFAACRQTQAEYRDVGERLKDVEASLQSAKDLYDRAVQSEEQSHLDRAKTLYEESLAACTPLADAPERLKRVKFSVDRLEEARALERQKRLFEAEERYQAVLERHKNHAEARGSVDRIQSTLAQCKKAYESMLEAQRKGNFPQAQSYASEIRKHCSGFRDVDERAPFLEAEVDYAHGCSLEEEKKYREALQVFDRLQKKTPDFRDVRDHLRALREKIGREGEGAAAPPAKS
jgi:tetratricopeptide (TPR) repeat protein